MDNDDDIFSQLEGKSKAHTAAEHQLSTFFPRTHYNDVDLQTIAHLLHLSEKATWSSIPRIYTVLRIIDHLDLIDTFQEGNFSDIWFPFHPNNLPSQLSESIKTRFLESQHIVFTQSLDLEKGEAGRHVVFAKRDVLWFESRGILGRGAFGEVDKVVSLISFKEYARKRMRRGTSFTRSMKEIDAFKAELGVFKGIDHLHCVKLVGSYTDTKYVGFLMSPVADCNLADFLVDAVSDNDKKSILRRFFGCLSSALQYLHLKKIRHRDIKPANILVKGDSVYLTDFGISLDWSEMTGGTTTTDGPKTMMYCAPEVARFEPRGSSSDVWSLGCVFMEMVTVLKGKSVEDLRAYFQEQTKSYRFHANIEGCGKWLAQLEGLSKLDNPPIGWCRKMLALDRTQRMSADDLLETIRHISRYEEGCTNQEIFCGHCCLEDDLHSFGSSGDDANPWDEIATKGSTSSTPAQSPISTITLSGNQISTPSLMLPYSPFPSPFARTPFAHQTTVRASIRSAHFPSSYLRMDASGAPFTGNGGGTVNVQSYVGPFETLVITFKPNTNPTFHPSFSISSTTFPNLYLRMDGHYTIPGGFVNCQRGAGPFEMFRWVRCQSDNQEETWGIESVVFPGRFLRMDASGGGWDDGDGGVVNVQNYVGPWENFIVTPLD